MKMNIYERRWIAIRNHAQKLFDLKESDSSYIWVLNSNLCLDGYLVINEVQKSIMFIDTNCVYLLYEGNPDFDHGAHDPMEKTRHDFDKAIYLVRKVII